MWRTIRQLFTKYILNYNHISPFHANLFATNLLLNSRTTFLRESQTCRREIVGNLQCDKRKNVVRQSRGSLEKTCETKRYSWKCRKILTNVSQLSSECHATFVRHICKIRPNCTKLSHSMRLQHENCMSRNSRELVFSCRIPVRYRDLNLTPSYGYCY